MDESYDESSGSSCHSNDEEGSFIDEELARRRRQITEELQKVLDLTPIRANSLFQRFKSVSAKPTAASRSESSDNDNEETSYLQIKSGPIILQDPNDVQEVIDDAPKIKRPYLRRGTGLSRFNMTVNDFKKPPVLYQKKEFRSYLKADNPNRKKPINIASVTSRLCPQPTSVTGYVPANIPKKVAPRRLPPPPCAKPPPKMSHFDHEIIPTLRTKTPSVAFEVNVPKTFTAAPNKGLTFADVPKTPLKRLLLKPPSPKMNREEFTRNEEKENRIFELLEQRVEESDFSVSNSSVKRLMNGSITSGNCNPRKLEYAQPEPPGQMNVVARKFVENSEGEESDESTDGRPVRRVYTQQDVALQVKRKALQDNVKKLLDWNVVPRRKHAVRRIVKKIKAKKSPRVAKKESICMPELKARLLELEKQKNVFMRDNNKLKRIEKEAFDEKMKLDRQRREEEKKLKEEREVLLTEKEKLFEDQKKLIREKQVFEKYCKETKNLPTREEREEIRTLKEEVEKLKDLLNTKEARWGSAQARLRNQIKLLEDENSQLKKDLDVAKKTTTKKVCFESQRAVNTKVIHAINQQLEKKLSGKVDSNKAKGRPLSLRETAAVRPKPLQRSKSAVDIKVKANTVRERSATVEPVRLVMELHDKHDNAEDSEEEPEVIDMFGEEQEVGYFAARRSEVLKRTEEVAGRSNSADSGLGSRGSNSEMGGIDREACQSQFREMTEKPGKPYCEGNSNCSVICNSVSVPPSYTAILDQKHRSWGLLGHKQDGGQLCGRTQPPENSQRHQETQSALYKESQRFTTMADKTAAVSRRVLQNGDVEESFPDGKRTTTCAASHVVRTVFPNGDIREKNMKTGSEKHIYRETGVCQTTFQDRPGYQQLDLPDGRTTVYHPDGNIDTLFPNGTTSRRREDGKEEWRFPTGEIVWTDLSGEKILIFPDGRRELDYKDYTRLEDPSGTVKTVYKKDGRQETRYPNGRIRVKDKEGNLIMNTAGF